MANFLPWNLANSFWNFCNVFSSPKRWSKAVSKWIAGGQLFTTFCQLLGKQWLLEATQLATRCLFKLEWELFKATHDHGFPSTSYIILWVECGSKWSFDLCVCVCLCTWACVFSLPFLFGRKFWKSVVEQSWKILLIITSPQSLEYKCLDVWSVYSRVPFPIMMLFYLPK